MDHYENENFPNSYHEKKKKPNDRDTRGGESPNNVQLYLG